MLQRIRGFFGQLVVYGLGDVSTQVVSLFLLPLFTRHLSLDAYGLMGLLLTIEVIASVVFRWGIDTAFMRFYYDCADDAARQRLASTIVIFLAVVSGSLLAVGIAASGWIGLHYIGTADVRWLVALTLANTFVSSFFFLGYNLMRIRQQPRRFIALSAARSFSTVIARLILVLWAGLGVMGIVLADVFVTIGVAIALFPLYAPLVRPVLSRPVLRDVLAFGLPRIPHSLAHQVIGTFDRYFLNKLGLLADVGLYGVGATFGLTVKLFLRAFETTWTPFFLGAMHESDSRKVLSTVSTYVMAVLTLLVTGLCVVSPELVQLFTDVKFHSAAAVTPWIALGALFQGIYLVGSVGIVITKKTKVYPFTTGLAAAVNVIANLVLIPSHGMLGAAWANLAAYATLGVVTTAISLRAYPIPYEWSRLGRIALAGVAGFVVARQLVPADWHVLVRLIAHGLLAMATFAIVLFGTRFFHAGELQYLREIRDRARLRTRPRPAASDDRPVEMAGEIIDTPSEPNAEGYDVDTDPADRVTGDSKDRRR